MIQNPPTPSAALGEGAVQDSRMALSPPEIHVALLTGGSDKPFVYGMTTELASKGATVDLIGSDELDCPEIRNQARLHFFNLRGDQRAVASLASKLTRVTRYYFKLVRYAAAAKPKIFHILWNNKFETFDRTLLLLYYKCLGKSIVITAHNVNAAKRDRSDSALNRLTLRIQYRLADHIFVHTEKMKSELIEEFGVPAARVTVIPFGINNFAPNTRLTPAEAKEQLGIRKGEKTILFFGRIAPYKGVEYLLPAFRQVLSRHKDYRLIIAGRLDAPTGERYFDSIREALSEDLLQGRILVRTEFIPDAETEIYFKAADALVLPYRQIYQSGVLFLGHSFGLPVLASDVGSLKDEIIEGKNGFVFKADDTVALAAAIEKYFASDLFANLNARRQEIRDLAATLHSWDVVGQRIMSVYADLLRLPRHKNLSRPEASESSVEVQTPS